MYPKKADKAKVLSKLFFSFKKKSYVVLGTAENLGNWG
ncbi:MAG: hypothetical protein HN576_14340 [Bacteriovoracaceae bacterium]|nr:hypothetical protein [Bacteriovoracaceae bacterium]